MKAFFYPIVIIVAGLVAGILFPLRPLWITIVVTITTGIVYWALTTHQAFRDWGPGSVAGEVGQAIVVCAALGFLLNLVFASMISNPHHNHSIWWGVVFGFLLYDTESVLMKWMAGKKPDSESTHTNQRIQRRGNHT